MSLTCKTREKMGQTGRPYDPEYHARNQQRHGSWVLQLNPKALN